MRNRYRRIGVAVMILVGFLSMPLYAAEEGAQRTESRRRLEIHPAGAVHRMQDWLATRHVPKQERAAVIAQRKAERETENAAEAIKQEQRRAEKRALFDADKKKR